MRDVRMTIAISNEEKAELRTAANRMGITPAEFVRYAVFKFLKLEGEKQ